MAYGNGNPDNPEYIMTRQYTASNWDYQDMVRYTSMRPNQLGGWSSVTPTQNLVDSYWTVDGKEPSIPSKDERAAAYAKLRLTWMLILLLQEKLSSFHL